VRCPPGDNLALHHAIYAAAAGDVIVADCGQAPEFGYWGEITTVAAQTRGIAGLVITGGVRDREQILHIGFPVFCTCTCIRGTVKDPAAGGRIGIALQVGDVRVLKGDLVCGDIDGVVIVPRGECADILAKCRARDDDEAAQIERLRGGESTLEILHLPSLPSGD
jgi:4-hydroxy-4-methyl-2-oxoglutarate aldolase